jgi:CHRD domain-containing protein
MKKRLALLGIATLVLGALGMSVYGAHFDTALRARLRGLNEVPPTASRATADFRATLNAAETQIDFTLTFSGLTANLAASHIHFGPTKVNGGVMVFFCGGGGQAACPAATSGTITGTITAANVVGPAAQGIAAGDFADVVRAIRTGNSYANMHNATFPTGEIRGKVFVVGFDERGGDDDGDD